MVDLSVRIGDLTLDNPIMPASGTFSPELANVMDLNRLGALVAKSITRAPRTGNPTPRVAEVEAGLLNSIGIPSKGLDDFLNEIIPAYKAFTPPFVASISADSVEEFGNLCRAIDVRDVDVIELNISCPNLEAGGKAFALDPEMTEQAVASARGATAKPLWVKLSPNVTSITDIARAAESGGADALVVANTILAMSVDSEKFRAGLGTVTGGLSGPAIKSIILRMVWQCAEAVKIPVIGCGGISTADDVVQYMIAGASAVQVGTVTFRHPAAMATILDELPVWCARKGITAISNLTGTLITGISENGLMEGIR